VSRQELPVLMDPSCCAPMVAEPLGDTEAADLARGFKALGDPVRLRLLSLIAARAGGEVCVCELTDAFTLTGPTISHHLRVLREAGLVDCQRRGTWVYYWVVPAALAALSRLLDTSPMTAAATTVGVGG
jgi:ArsR family transcriptional regulator